MDLPKIIKVRQNLETAAITDIAGTVKEEMRSVNLSEIVTKGQRIAVTAGSRGVANIALIIKAIIAELKALGAEPFVVPGMGSHGGATAEGQIEILKTLGVTEATVGVPIISSMETVQIGTTDCGIPVFIDKNAAEADGIIVVNRVKPHTSFKGEIESGLMKMMVIGLGKLTGSQTAHRHFLKKGQCYVIPTIARYVMANARILLGVAIIENAYHQTAIVKAMRPEKLEEEEKKLLVQAKQLLARLPFDKFDVLIISEMGKEISGVGMDPNVTGRICGQSVKPIITRIVVLNLTPETHGNAAGIGLADFVTQRLVDATNFDKTYTNCLTSLSPRSASIPIVCKNDFDAVNKALNSCGTQTPEESAVVWIKNTLELSEIYVSEALLPQVAKISSLAVVSENMGLPFDEHGNLAKWTSL